MNGYLDITEQEKQELRNMSIEDRVEVLEILLRVADEWKKSLDTLTES